MQRFTKWLASKLALVRTMSDEECIDEARRLLKGTNFHVHRNPPEKEKAQPLFDKPALLGEGRFSK